MTRPRSPLLANLRWLFLGSSLLAHFTVDGGAKEPAFERIVAGPFSTLAPVAWAEGALVEKMPNQPLYSVNAWQARLKNQALKLKPDYSNRPEHWMIGFPKLVLPGDTFDIHDASEDPVAPQILIHKAAEWAEIYEDGTFDAVAARRMTKQLRAMVENQDPTKTPVAVDAELHFVVGRKKIRFQGGHGFRVLAQWNDEPDLIRKGGLQYLFLGLSDNDSCQIVATFPVDLPGLLAAEDSKAEHLGFSSARYAELNTQFRKYERAAKKWLTVNLEKATPSLQKLDEMMASLIVSKWE